MKIALVGNPNSGKSSLFNTLTGLNQKVGNFPGVTVERKAGKVQLSVSQSATLIDLPGIHSLYPNSEDEEVACEIIRNPQHPDHADLWVVVVDATQLRRGLLLCTQLMDLQLPVVLAINMIDLVDTNKPTIDYAKLSQKLDIPVIPISARYNKGLDQLKEVLSHPVEISKTRILKIPEGLSSLIADIQPLVQSPSEYLAYMALLQPDYFRHIAPDSLRQIREKSPFKENKPLVANELLVRYDRIDICLEEAHKPVATAAEKKTERIDKVLLHPVWGYAIFAAILFLIFQALFNFAKPPQDFIEDLFAEAGSFMRSQLPQGFLTDLLVNGIWAGIAGIVVFVPQIAFLFFFIALLEESGYMSRVVFLMDKIMRPFGLSGRAVVPLVGGFACAVPSIMMARTIPHKHERLITILVTPLMSCSARLPVYLLLVSVFIPETAKLWGFGLQGVVMMGFYVLGFLMALLAAFVLKLVLKYSSNGIFVTEMPLYRSPRWQNVGLTIWDKTRSFVFEAGKVIVIISIALWALSSFAPGDAHQEIEAKYENLLVSADSTQATQAMEAEKLQVSYAGRLGKIIEPVIRPLGYDWKIGIALLTSFAAREVFTGTMGVIYGMGEGDMEDDNERKSLAQRVQKEYSHATALSLMIFYAFAMQCMSTLVITKRETGSWKWAILMFTYLTVLAYVAAWVAYNVFV